MSTQLCPQAALSPEQSGKERLGCTEDEAARAPPRMAVSQQGSLLQNLLLAVQNVHCLVGPAQGPAKGWHCTRHRAAGVRQCLTALAEASAGSSSSRALDSVVIPSPSVPRCGSRAGSGAQVCIFRVNKPQAGLVLCWCQSCSDLDYRSLLVFFQCTTHSNNRSEAILCHGSSLSDPHRHLRQCLYNRLEDAELSSTERTGRE